MEAAIDELVRLSESISRAAALLADENVDEQSSSAKRASTFLNVVALGNVGAGKSAVLNSLIGHPVLPTGENGVTQAPISIDLQRDSSLNTKSIFLEIDNKTQQVSASALWHSLQDRLSKGASSKGCGEEIHLKIHTSTAPPLKLIDLPGLDQGIMDDSMIGEYAEHNDAILLVVIPASEAPEISSSRALTLAKKFDADGTRTIGVISKLDQPSSDQKTLAAVQALLLNQGPGNTNNIPWVTLIGQSGSIASAQSEFGVDYSLETVWRAESESLKSIMIGAPQSKLGRVALVETLASQICKRMKVKLPNVLPRRSRSGKRKKKEEKTETKTTVLRIEKIDKRLIFKEVDLFKFSTLEGLRAHLRPTVNPSDPHNTSIQLVFTVWDESISYCDDEDLGGKSAQILFQATTGVYVCVEPSPFPAVATPVGLDRTTVVRIKNYKNRSYTIGFDLSRFATLEALRKVLRIPVNNRNPQCRIQMLFTVRDADARIFYCNDQNIPADAARNLFEIATQLDVELEPPLSPPRPSPTQIKIENTITIPRKKRKMRVQQQQQGGTGAQPPNPQPVTTTEKTKQPAPD